MGENNGHEAIRYRVVLSFSDNHNGYQKEYVSHKQTTPEAILEAMLGYLSKDTANDYPLCGIAVYQCVFTA